MYGGTAHGYHFRGNGARRRVVLSEDCPTSFLSNNIGHEREAPSTESSISEACTHDLACTDPSCGSRRFVQVRAIFS